MSAYFPDTWTCHVCGRERPDARISVQKNDTSAEWGLPAGTITENVRYCNDSEECTRLASTIKFGHQKKG